MINRMDFKAKRINMGADELPNYMKNFVDF
jgi:hypothetical protein